MQVGSSLSLCTLSLFLPVPHTYSPCPMPYMCLWKWVLGKGLSERGEKRRATSRNQTGKGSPKDTHLGGLTAQPTPSGRAIHSLRGAVSRRQAAAGTTY